MTVAAQSLIVRLRQAGGDAHARRAWRAPRGPVEGSLNPQHRHNLQETEAFISYRTDLATNHATERNARKPAFAATCDDVAASSSLPPDNAATAGTYPTTDGEPDGVL